VDLNLYYIVCGEGTLILIQYVDDLFIIGGEELIADCKRGLASKFEMKDIGLMHYFLGIVSLAGGWAHFSGTGEVRNGYFEQISDGGLQTHVNTYGHQMEEAC
jgi:hypothetical protein